MCTDGKPCFSANFLDGDDLQQLSKQELKEIAATTARIKKLHKVEVTYRTFTLIGLVHQAEDLAKAGIDLVNAGQFLQATGLFHELQDCRKAMDWLLDLPQESCPDITPTEDTEQAARMRGHSILRELINTFANTDG